MRKCNTNQDMKLFCRQTNPPGYLFGGPGDTLIISVLIDVPPGRRRPFRSAVGSGRRFGGQNCGASISCAGRKGNACWSNEGRRKEGWWRRRRRRRGQGQDGGGWYRYLHGGGLALWHFTSTTRLFCCHRYRVIVVGMEPLRCSCMTRMLVG